MALTHATDQCEVIHDDEDSSPTESGGDSAEPGPAHVDAAAQGVPHPQTYSARPSFTITDAASSCSVSRKTITRKLSELAGYGAAKDDDGVWRIPVEALLAVGLHPGRSRQDPAPAPRRPAPEPPSVRTMERDTITVPRDRWDDMRIRLARAEAEASERALALADARLALRALTAGPVGAAATAKDSTQGTGEPGEPARAATAAAAAGQNRRPPPTIVTDPPPVAVSSPMSAATPGVPSPVPLITAESPSAAAAVDYSSVASDPAAADVVAARNLAARTGGYVPAAPVRPRNRRWWQSK